MAIAVGTLAGVVGGVMMAIPPINRGVGMVIFFGLMLISFILYAKVKD